MKNVSPGAIVAPGAALLDAAPKATGGFGPVWH